MNVGIGRRFTSRSVAVVTAAALSLAALALAPLGAAFGEVNERPAPLGLLGLSEGQTIRVSVAHVVAFDPQPDPPGRCSLKVGFVDARGVAIGNPHLFELPAGSARSFDHVAIGNPNIREYVRPVVADVTERAECPAVVSLEVLDRGGVSGIIIHDSIPLRDPWYAKK